MQSTMPPPRSSKNPSWETNQVPNLAGKPPNVKEITTAEWVYGLTDELQALTPKPRVPLREVEKRRKDQAQARRAIAGQQKFDTVGSRRCYNATEEIRIHLRNPRGPLNKDLE